MNSIRGKLLTIAKMIAAIAGAYLILRLISFTGWDRIVTAFRTHWFALLGITAIYTIYHLLRTSTLQFCTPSKASFVTLFGVRLAGEAVAYLAIGSVLGDTLKVVLARDRIPVVDSATGVFAEKLIYHLAGAGFILGGLFLAGMHLGTNRLLLYSMLAVTLFFLGLLFLLSSGFHPVSTILRFVKVRRPKLREAVLKTEESLFQFRTEHPRRFWLVFLINVLTYFYSVAEVFVIYLLLGFQPAFWAVWYYQAAVKLTSSANVVIPANLGIFEATNAFLAQQLDLGTEAGLIAALFVRARAILWCVVGYGCFVYYLYYNKDEQGQKLKS
jgi:hypothetical protein